MPYYEALLFYEEALKWLDWSTRQTAMAQHAPDKLNKVKLYESPEEREKRERLANETDDVGWQMLKNKFR